MYTWQSSTLFHPSTGLSLGFLYGRLRFSRSVHVLCDDRTREARPKQARLVWLLLVFGRYPLGRDLLAVLLRVKQNAFLSL